MNEYELMELESESAGFSRREFIRKLAGSSALSIVALDKMNSIIYRDIDDLNRSYRQDESPDGVYWEAVGKHFLFQDGLIMMNNGTVGPMPRPVFNTLMRYFRLQATNPFDVYNYLPGFKEEVRRKLAGFVGATPDEIALSHNTTEGMNLVASGLEMEPGDEALLSSMEHPGGTHPWNLKAARHGIVVKDVPIGLPPQNVNEVTRAFRNGITDRTKIISVSHTVYISGLIAPIKELSELAHERGILLVADSAHGLGMLNLNMHDLGMDYFTSSPYKWLGAPCGIGLFYAKQESQERLWPTIVSSGWDREGSARRLEPRGQAAAPLYFALGEALDFQTRIGKSRIERRIKTLAGYLKNELETIPGARLHTSKDPYLSGGLTAFSVEGVSPQRMVDYLREKYNIVIRTIGSQRDGTAGVRVSTHIYIMMKHIDMLLEGVKYLADRRA